MSDLLKLSVINLFYLVGVFIVFGLIFDRIEFLNNSFISKSFGKIGIILTGFIGTVIHELSHLIMCLIFRHKIVEVKFFRPLSGQSDGVLGYVNHSYNKKSLYQGVGNFFIGIAPLIGGTLSILVLFKLLLPQTFNAITTQINLAEYISYMANFNIIDLINLLIKDISMGFSELFFNKSIFSLKYILFLFLMYSISTHMSLSKQDMIGSLSGLSIIFILVVIFTILLSIFKDLTPLISSIVIQYNILVILFMLIGLFFSLLTLGISYLFSIIIK